MARKDISDMSRRLPGIDALQKSIKDWIKDQTIGITKKSSNRLGHKCQHQKT